MNHREAIGGNLPERLHVHRRIVGVALAAIAWTLAAVWILFSHSYYGPLLFGVVTLLVLMFVALPGSFSVWAAGAKSIRPSASGNGRTAASRPPTDRSRRARRLS